MSVALPRELASLLDEVGGSWPEADEDRLHELASSWRRIGDQLERLRGEANSLTDSVTATHHGASIDAFSARWKAIDGHLAFGSVSAHQTAVAVDGLAQATLSAKSSIVDVLAAGQEQKRNIQETTANVAFIGPLIGALARLLRPYIAQFLSWLARIVMNSLRPLLGTIARVFREIGLELAEMLGELFSPPTPPPTPLPPAPVYKRDAPLPHARDLIARGTEWTGTGRGGGKLPLAAEPNQVLYRRNHATGTISNYSVYDEQGYILKRVDMEGSPHGGVATPHVLEYRVNTNPKTGQSWPGPDKDNPIRTARPEEQP